MEPIHQDDQKVKNLGIKIITDLCVTLVQNGIRGLHFYTMNLEGSVFRIIDSLVQQ